MHPITPSNVPAPDVARVVIEGRDFAVLLCGASDYRVRRGGVLAACEFPGFGEEAGRLTSCVSDGAREDLRALAARHVAAAHREFQHGFYARSHHQFLQARAINDQLLEVR